MSITRYSVEDYEEMIRRGALTEYDKVVLIRGEIIPKRPTGPKHSGCLKKMNRTMGVRVGDRAIVAIQDPVRLLDSEPETDLSLLFPRADFFTTSHPEPPDILLLVEISDSSLAVDRNLMKEIYPEAGIVEYWIVNLVDQSLEVHRGPRPDGTYEDERILKRGESIEVAALPGVVVGVDELF